MKIAILSRNAKLYSTRRLVEAAQARGHEVRVLDVLRCYMNITSNRPSIHYKGEDLTGLRRRDPAYRCLGHLLRHGGLAPVRDDERTPAQRVGCHHAARATNCVRCSCWRARVSACR